MSRFFSRRTRKYQILNIDTPESRRVGIHTLRTQTPLQNPNAINKQNSNLQKSVFQTLKYQIDWNWSLKTAKIILYSSEILSIRMLARNTFQEKHGQCCARIETKRCDIEIRIDWLAKRRTKTSRTNYRFIKTSILKYCRVVIAAFFR